MAAGATYEPIATQTLASATALITFSSIAASWTDLRLIITAKTPTDANIYLRYNSDSATNYSYIYLRGYSTISGSSRASAQTSNFLTFQGYPGNNNSSVVTADIFNYAGSTFKTLLSTDSRDDTGVSRAACMWRSTAAITSIGLTSDGNFSIGTVATLYGIKAA